MAILLFAKDGIFRRYRGPGIFEDLQNYILQKKWQSVEPLTGWKSPASLTMSGMAGLFSISGKIWATHQRGGYHESNVQKIELQEATLPNQIGLEVLGNNDLKDQKMAEFLQETQIPLQRKLIQEN
ncbi:hypothetical protein P7K49_009355 [Saguinus oedipus]|uniref:Uncharacterized protein n=1 Tax=Saguinus oedipus TaxID=9490 RepID=A0ABQ9VJR5_SAGOE|nr:hypothetical protein P7K49_009355 [Saguinus oedipus]